jgi:hypothetical protein
MTINTFLSGWAFPKPTVFGFLYSFQKMLANLIKKKLKLKNQTYKYININLLAHTISVVGLFPPAACFFSTTCFSLSSSQLSIVSVSLFVSLSTSQYKDRFSAFLSILKSCENLHLSPLKHCPCLKNVQMTDFGSIPEKIHNNQ